MPTLALHASKFQGTLTSINKPHAITLSEKKCLKFAATVGLSRLRQTHSGQVALSLAMYRALAVKCAIDFTGSSVRIQREFRRLETTEKANISYWIGMTFAGIAADSLLKVPRLVHATQFTDAKIRRRNNASKSLADLLGPDDNGQFHVLEAKGVGRASVSTNTREHWKEQAGTIKHVNGSKPASASYCAGFLRSPCWVEIEDPPPGGSNYVTDIQGSLSTFGDDYYSPFLKFLSHPTKQIIGRDGRRIHVRVLAYDPQSGEYVYIGLDDSTWNAAKAGNGFDSLREFETDDCYIGRDGVAIVSGSDPCKVT